MKTSKLPWIDARTGGAVIRWKTAEEKSRSSSDICDKYYGGELIFESCRKGNRTLILKAVNLLHEMGNKLCILTPFGTCCESSNAQEERMCPHCRSRRILESIELE